MKEGMPRRPPVAQGVGSRRGRNIMLTVEQQRLELERHSKIGGIELGARRVAEVLLGCVVGVAVRWAMSKLWPLPNPKSQPNGLHP
jgi:hypothetical protein